MRKGYLKDQVTRLMKDHEKRLPERSGEKAT
jgi:hypothetical protein